MGVASCKDLGKPFICKGLLGWLIFVSESITITYMTTTTLTISTNALSDHMDRLYDIHDMTHTGNDWFHVDGAESGIITIIKRGDKTTKVAMTKSAIDEFISDMDYQVEVSEDWDVRAYRAQCKRALTSIRKQLKGN